MFYRMYLKSVCNRRQWPEPAYEPYQTRHGHFCKVRVNNREYSTEMPYQSEDLALDAAAMKAFMICRDFSRNDGMLPSHRPGQSASNGGVVQGLPVAIGHGRRSNRDSASSCESESLSSTSDSAVSGYSNSDDSSSGASSPHRLDDGFSLPLHRTAATKPITPTPKTSRRLSTAPRHAASVASHRAVTEEYMCMCRRGPIHAYERCAWCLRECGYA